MVFLCIFRPKNDIWGVARGAKNFGCFFLPEGRNFFEGHLKKNLHVEEKVKIEEGKSHVEAIQEQRKRNMEKRLAAMRKIKPPKKRDRSKEVGNQGGKLTSEIISSLL